MQGGHQYSTKKHTEWTYAAFLGGTCMAARGAMAIQVGAIVFFGEVGFTAIEAGAVTPAL